MLNISYVKHKHINRQNFTFLKHLLNFNEPDLTWTTYINKDSYY